MNIKSFFKKEKEFEARCCGCKRTQRETSKGFLSLWEFKACADCFKAAMELGYRANKKNILENHQKLSKNNY